MSAEDSQGLSNPKFLNCQEVLSVGLTGLVEGKFLGQFLSSDSDWERIFAWIRDSDFSDFDGVIGQKEVNDVFGSFANSVEFKHFSIIFQELLLGGHSSTS